MIGRIVGALVGAEVERRRGGRGVAGAVLGLAAAAAIRRLGPLGLLAGGAFVAKRAYDRHRDADAIPAGPVAAGQASRP